MADEPDEVNQLRERVAVLEADNVRLSYEKQQLVEVNRQLIAMIATELLQRGVQEPKPVWKGATPMRTVKEIQQRWDELDQALEAPHSSEESRRLFAEMHELVAELQAKFDEFHARETEEARK